MQHCRDSHSCPRRERAVSNIMGIALGIALTISMAGAVAYFATQETTVLTTHESFGIIGPKLLVSGSDNVLSLSIKNTGTSPFNTVSVNVIGVCQFEELEAPTIKPGATYGITKQIDNNSCVGESEPVIEAGESYIVQIDAIAAGTDSVIQDALTVTARY